MRRWRDIGVAFLALFMAACSAPEADVGEGEGALTGAATQPLAAEDFTAELSRGFIEGTHSLSKEVFDTKWKASRSESALMFFRAYPGAYHKDFAANLKPAAKAKIPMAKGLCLGDAHPDNFGFLRLDSKVIYNFNDLDDSGHCVLALDALRYVAAVRLYFDADLAKTAAKRYLSVLSGERTEPEAKKEISDLRDELKPDFAERRNDKLEALVTDDALEVTEGMKAVSAANRTKLMDAAKSAIPGVTPLDVVEVEREGGGSGGLTRYWVLVRRGGSRTLLELKEAATPGVDFGIDAKPIGRASRLSLLKREIWGVPTDKDYVYVDVLGKTFLVRDRLAKASLDLPKMKKKELEDVIQAQATVLALLHKGKLQVANEGEAAALRRWLEDSSDVIAARWRKAFK